MLDQSWVGGGGGSSMNNQTDTHPSMRPQVTSFSGMAWQELWNKGFTFIEPCLFCTKYYFSMNVIGFQLLFNPFLHRSRFQQELTLCALMCLEGSWLYVHRCVLMTSDFWASGGSISSNLILPDFASSPFPCPSHPKHAPLWPQVWSFTGNISAVIRGDQVLEIDLIVMGSNSDLELLITYWKCIGGDHRWSRVINSSKSLSDPINKGPNNVLKSSLIIPNHNQQLFLQLITPHDNKVYFKYLITWSLPIYSE